MTRRSRGTADQTQAVSPRTDETEQRLHRLHHDILERLSTISLIASTAALDPDLQSGNRHRLRTVPGEVRRLVILVDELIEHHRDAGPVVPLDDVVRGAIAELAVAGGPRLTFTRSSALVAADPAGLAVAVRALIADAVSACGDGGVVEIHAETVPDGLALVVDDNAAGLHSDSDRGSLGTVHDFAEAQGGQLTISRGRFGGGSRVLSLPRAI